MITRRSVLTALAAAVILVSLTFSAQAQEGGKTKSAVLIFPIKVDGLQLQSSVKKALQQYLGTCLTMERFYSVMPESQIKVDLGGAKVESYKECYDESCQIQLGKAVAADKSLAVYLYAIDKKCRVTATIYDLRTEMSDAAAEASGGCRQNELMDMMKVVAARLSGRIVEDPSGGSAALTTVIGGAGASTVLVSIGSQKSGADSAAAQTSTMGILTVTGSPDGALVEIAGPAEFGREGKQSGILPLKPLRVPAGNYTVKFAAKDYDLEERTVWVYPGATAEVNVTLVYAFGQIELTGGPAGLAGKLECQKNHKQDITLPGPGTKVKLTVPRGDCHLTLQKEGYDSFDRTFPVDGGKTVTLDATLNLNPSGIRWVRIPSGSFLMGSNGPEASSDEKPIHQVTVQAFEIAQTEVTVAQYRKCFDAGDCSKPGTRGTGGKCNWAYSDREDHPINCLDWDQASAYAKWAGGRLPTEAEWEYAARAGTSGERYGEIDSIAWYGGGIESQTRAVGQKQANKFGLNDMLGNVWEWCQDRYHDSYNGAPSNGSAFENPPGYRHVLRGGSWNCDAKDVRVAARDNWNPAGRGNYGGVGFRCVR